MTTTQTVEEMTNGYKFIYPNQPSLLQKIAEWIAYENRCCPFIKFSLYVSEELTGDENVKSLLREKF